MLAASVAADLLPALAPGANAAAADTAPLFVDAREGTIDCEGHDVNVTSSNAMLAFTGRCEGIYFVGTGTTATIESAKLVQATGNAIRLTAKGEVAEAYLIGKDSQLDVDGIGTLYLNCDSGRVDANAIGTIDAVGNRNTVHWVSGKPKINDVGSGNVLTPKS